MDKEEFKAKQEEFRQKVFILMFQLLFIFGLPIIPAFLLGNYLDKIWGTNPKGLLASLAVAFIFSWTLVLIKYRQASRDLKELNEIKKKIN